MSRKQAALIVAGMILSACSSFAQSGAEKAIPDIPGVPPAAHQAAMSIDAEKIRAHVRFLSLDLLEGRGPGTRGDKLAAEYIATQFALDGVQPAGDDHTYFQRVPLYAVHTLEDKTRFSFVPASGSPVELTYGTEIVAKDQTGQAAADIDAPIVFVGYGIHAPEYHWDDYAGVDLKGKVALVIVNEPPSEDVNFFKGKALTYYGRWTYKYEEAARRGAVGVLIIHRTDLASYGWEVVRNSQAIEKRRRSEMTIDTVNETERMTVTRVFDAPRELVWKAWTDPKYIMQWWGPKGFTAPVCKMDFRVGGKLLCCMRSPDGQEFWNAVEYLEIVPPERIVSSMYFSDPEGNKVDPAQLGIEHEAIEGAYDVALFEDLGNGQTKLTFIGNEPMESAKNSGQLEGWNQILDKIADVVAGLAQAK